MRERSVPVMNENYVVISTDCHAGGSMDQYREFLDPKWLPEFEAWRGAYKNPFRDLSGSKRYRNWDSDARLSEMEDDGIVAEVAFPNTVPPFFPSASFMARAPKDRDEYEMRWAGLQAHNRWVRDHYIAAAPERRAGMAQILLNDVDDAVDTIHWAAANGLRGGILLPGVPPDSHLPPLYATDVYEPIWDALEETGLPVNHHSGSAAPDYGKYPAGGVMWLLETGFYAHRAFWSLIFGGVFERHPKLKFVLAESGMGWLAEELPRTDFLAKRIFGGKIGELGFTDDQRLPKLPSEYFQQNVWVTASFMGPAECRKRNDGRCRQDHVGERLPARRRDVSVLQGVAAQHVPRRARGRGADDALGDRREDLRLRPRQAAADRGSSRHVTRRARHAT